MLKYKAPAANIGPLPGATPKVPLPVPEIDFLSFVEAPVQPPIPTQFGINPPPKRTPDIPLLTPQELGMPQRMASARRPEENQFYETHESA